MTNFWWVNQSGSYKHDLQLGILWAPLRNSQGHKTSHWESLDRVQSGDVVFHYAGQEIKAVSCVSRGSMSAIRPYEGGSEWQKDGRSVQTVYSELDAPLPLSEIPLELRQAQRFKNSAFKTGGGVNEGYLWDLSQDFGIWLSDRLNLIEGGDAAESDEDDSQPAARAYFDETNRKVVVNARREQSTLRGILFGDKAESECAICGRTLPVELLTTAHIKKRSVCETSERNDPNVVMGACNLGCDALFEKHYIVVDEDGIVQAGARKGTNMVSAALASVLGRTCTALTPKSSVYFEYHRARNAELNSALV